MLFLRSLLVNFLLYLWVALCLIICLPVLFMPHKYAIHMARFIGNGVMVLLKFVMGITYEIRGQEYAKQGPLLIASKHQSFWDTIIYQIILPDVAFVLKKDLLRIPIYGQFIRKFDMIAIDRKQKGRSVINLVDQAKAILADGRRIVLFPEGTRVLPGESRPYKRGIAMIYENTDVMVVPVALNSGLCWPRRSFLKHPGKIILEFLPPIAPGLSRANFMEELTTRIEKASNRLMDEAKN